ncbi:hypothetical protein ACTHGU_20185 [Chitinophagaceae bacterium MMS25-I14]
MSEAALGKIEPAIGKWRKTVGKKVTGRASRDHLSFTAPENCTFFATLHHLLQ